MFTLQNSPALRIGLFILTLVLMRKFAEPRGRLLSLFAVLLLLRIHDPENSRVVTEKRPSGLPWSDRPRPCHSLQLFSVLQHRGARPRQRVVVQGGGRVTFLLELSCQSTCGSFGFESSSVPRRCTCRRLSPGFQILGAEGKDSAEPMHCL